MGREGFGNLVPIFGALALAIGSRADPLNQLSIALPRYASALAQAVVEDQGHCMIGFGSHPSCGNGSGWAARKEVPLVRAW